MYFYVISVKRFFKRFTNTIAGNIFLQLNKITTGNYFGNLRKIIYLGLPICAIC